MTITKLMTTGVAALAVLGAFAPAAAADEPGDGLSSVLHEVGDTLGTGDDQSRLHQLMPQPPVSTDLTSRVGDGLRAMGEELLR
jgi:hypothetical protein